MKRCQTIVGAGHLHSLSTIMSIFVCTLAYLLCGEFAASPQAGKSVASTAADTVKFTSAITLGVTRTVSTALSLAGMQALRLPLTPGDSGSSRMSYSTLSSNVMLICRATQVPGYSTAPVTNKAVPHGCRSSDSHLSPWGSRRGQSDLQVHEASNGALDGVRQGLHHVRHLEGKVTGCQRDFLRGGVLDLATRHDLRRKRCRGKSVSYTPLGQVAAAPTCTVMAAVGWSRAEKSTGSTCLLGALGEHSSLSSGAMMSNEELEGEK
ncbi:hypothetical protein E2C01_024611 [Portunus trituberculatus]|uniref:Uncharacterized protein n=1 Tax=Portunus trituberculatus TaxID=210409 RepID=A0A5B7EDM4_PORTR|nr:hypothetical protein [Portunus trituberculatus]